MPSVTTEPTGYWRDVRRVHRLEYPFTIAYACHALWGACYAVTNPTQLLGVPVLVALVATVVPIDAQNPLNAAQDVSTDSANPGKGTIAAAVLRLRPSHAMRWAGAEMAGAVLLAAVVSMWLGRPIVVLCVAAAVALHLLYNLEPVRLKGRGFLGNVGFALTFTLLPCLSTFGAVRADLPKWIWPTFGGLAVLMVGRHLWWTVPDRDADAAAGDRTFVVRYGARRSWWIACLSTAAGVALLGWGVWWRLGPLWSFVVIVATGLFLVDKLARSTRVSDERLPTEKRMRTHTLTLVVFADCVVALAPILATVTG